MKIIIEEERKGFFDKFRFKKKVSIKYRRTIGKVLGIGGGFKTWITSDAGLAEEGETKDIVERLISAAKGYPVPFRTTNISGYKVTARGTISEMERAGELEEASEFFKIPITQLYPFSKPKDFIKYDPLGDIKPILRFDKPKDFIKYDSLKDINPILRFGGEDE